MKRRGGTGSGYNRSGGEHGTYLIDPAGKVRWQDISYEPFEDAAFLIEEVQRLLAQ